MKWTGVFEIKCFNNGVLKWEDEAHNALTDEGEQQILDVYLRGATPPTDFYVGLTGMAGIAETTTLALLTTEPTETGYARIQVTRDNVGWPNLALDAGDFMATSKIMSFEAGATWTAVDKAFMSTSSDNTGKLISFAALSTTRTLVINDVLEVTYKVKLQ